MQEAMPAGAEDHPPGRTFGTADTGALGGEGGSAGGGEAIERAGDSIGPYRLLEILGEGGFGTVWLAERREPMVQRVALKVVKPGMDSKAVVARFEQERQALAVMDHPNVARVLDGGVTPKGRPYFVMEAVRGEPITAFCDRHRHTIRQRLALLADVCDAIQHAHSKGIIHRDIKPSNILVAMVDNRPVAKVIDFGVAKAVSHALTARTIHTERGQFIGTPEYMSPEQAEMGSLDIDTRTDVYSLGVVLYELLSGTRPFDGGSLRAAGYAEIQRIIREVEPPRPSTRVSSMDPATGLAVAAARQGERERIAGELRRELDWIPLKAMRKDRTRRYASAESLGADIRRYLDGRPLEAAPESRVYLARKFVRRHRGSVIAVGAVAVALVGGFGTALWQAHEAAVQRDAARDAAARADASAQAEMARASELKAVADFQDDLLSSVDATSMGVALMADLRAQVQATAGTDSGGAGDAFEQRIGGVNPTDLAAATLRRAILDPADATITSRFGGQPLVAAQLRQALAVRYRSLGFFDEALRLQVMVVEARRATLGDDAPDTIDARSHQVIALSDLGRFAEAEPIARDNAERARKALGPTHASTIDAVATIAGVLGDLGRGAEAEPLLREAYESSRTARGEHDPATVSHHFSLASFLRRNDQPEAAEPIYRDVLERRRRILGDDHRDTIASINALATYLTEARRPAEAEPLRRESVERSRRVLGEQHPSTLSALSNLAVLLQDQGSTAEAESIDRDVLARRQALLGAAHPDTLVSLGNLARLLRDTGRPAEAEPFYRACVDGSRRVLGPAHRLTAFRSFQFAITLFQCGKTDEAARLGRETVDTARRAFGPTSPNTIEMSRQIATMLEASAAHVIDAGGDAARFALAERMLLDAHAINVDIGGESGDGARGCAARLAALYAAWHHAAPGKGYDARAAEWTTRGAPRP